MHKRRPMGIKELLDERALALASDAIADGRSSHKLRAADG